MCIPMNTYTIDSSDNGCHGVFKKKKKKYWKASGDIIKAWICSMSSCDPFQATLFRSSVVYLFMPQHEVPVLLIYVKNMFAHTNKEALRNMQLRM